MTPEFLSDFTLSWAGECSAWECDDLGHMNMRHYVHKTDEARQGFMIRLGLKHAYQNGTVSSLRVRDFHIKYQGEARPGNSLRIDSAVLSIGECDIRLCHVMTHRDGRLAATMIETVEHIYLPEDKIFPWPQRLQESVKKHMAELPGPAKPRNIDLNIKYHGTSLSKLKSHNIDIIGAGVFNKSELDITEHVSLGSFFGRTTSTIGWFKKGWPEFENPAYHADDKSAVLLEMRAFIHRYPRRGDAYDYAPYLLSADSYTREIIHNVMDPISGKSWATMLASGCKFDLKTRKLLKTTGDELTALKKNIVSDITL